MTLKVLVILSFEMTLRNGLNTLANIEHHQNYVKADTINGKEKNLKNWMKKGLTDQAWNGKVEV